MGGADVDRCTTNYASGKQWFPDIIVEGAKYALAFERIIALP